MKVVLVGLLLFGLASAKMSCECGKRNTANTGRIIGGKPSHRNEYPWMVGFKKEKDPYLTFCGGAIVTKRHVISAAHCFEDTTADEIMLIVGAHDVNDASEKSSKRHEVKQIIMHPHYDNSNYKLNDISIVVTSRDMIYNEFVGPICMPSEEMDREMMGQPVRILGWGRYEPKFTNYDSVNNLRQVDVKIVSHRLCSNPDDALFCARSRERGSCMGDSGGPLAWLDHVERKFILVGVVSYGFSPCGNSTLPTVNTNVSGHLKWINKQIKRLKGNQKTCSKVSRSPYLTGDQESLDL